MWELCTRALTNKSIPKQSLDMEEVRRDVDWVKNFVKCLGGMLEKGEFSGHPYRIIAGGLEGVEEGLRRLVGGEARGRKFVYRVCE